MKSLRLPFIVRGQQVFYGWVIVAAGFLMTSLNGLSMQGFPTYLPLLSREFGWSKTALAGPRALTQAENALFGPINGYFIDKFGPRRIMLVGVFFFGLGMVLFAFIGTLWHYYAVNIIMAVGTSLCGFLGVTTSINSWFQRKRTLAISIGISGVTFSGVIGVPLLVFLQDSFGWRQAALFAGLASWAIGFPAALLVRDAPEKYGLRPDGDPPEDPQSSAPQTDRQSRIRSPAIDFTPKEAFRSRTYWYISAGFGVSGLAMQAISVHQFVHMEQYVGVARSSAALVITVSSSLAIIGRLAGGLLGDKLPKHMMLGIATLAQALAVLAFAFATDMFLLMVFAVLYGVSWGVRGPVSTALFGEYFGRTSFARIVGMQMLVSSPLGIAGPLVVGAMADNLGDYKLAFFLVGVISAVSGLIFFLAKPPPPPKRAASAEPTA